MRGLREAILAVHRCNSRHVQTVPVMELFKDQTLFDGYVEIFDLDGHPKAKRCFAWGYDDAGTLRSTAVLEIPPVDSPETAVKVAIAARIRRAEENS